MRNERDFQADLILELKEMFQGCFITKLDTSYIQGSPDLLILYKKNWATLECKKSRNVKKRPNQEHYVKQMNDMSFSRFISPENKEEVLREIQQAFDVNR
jgi:hypothetical protein